MWTLFWVFVCFFSLIFDLRLKRTLSMWSMLNRLLYDWQQGLIGTRSPTNCFFNYVRRLDYIVSESQRIKKQQQKAMAHRNTHTWVCPLTLKQCTSSDSETSNPYPIPEHLPKKIWKETSSLRTKSLTCINFKNAFQYTIGADKYYFIPLIRGT